jgi:CheY-like chemotaxis protein
MARILLVDDDDATRLTLGALLESQGHEITEAGSLEEARDQLAADADYDLIVLDRSLPDGLGTDLVPELRARIPRAKVVLVTGTSANDIDARLLDGVLTKGGDVGVLMTTIRKLVGSG